MATTPRPITSLTDAITAIEQPTQDALLAAQQRRQQMEAEYQAQLLAMQQAQAAAAQPAATPAQPTAAPAQPAQPGPWGEVSKSLFAKEFLPSRNMDVGGFAALPFEEREKLANEYIDARAKSQNMDAAQRQKLEALRDKVVYADTNGKAPSANIIRGVGDIGLAAGQGAVGAVRSITQLAGADNPVANSLKGVNDWLQEYKSTASKQEASNIERRIELAKKSGSTTEEIGAYLLAVKDQPAEMIAQGLGSLVTLGVGKAVQLIRAAQALKTGATATQAAQAASTAGKVANIGTATAQGVGTVKGQSYETTFKEAKAQGKSDEESARLASEAAEYSLANAPQQAAGAVLGGASGAFGIDRLAGLGLGQATARGLAGRTFTGALGEAVPEGLAAAQATLAANQAAIRAGVMDPSREFEGVAGSAAQEAVIGGTLGGGISAVAGPRANASPTAAPAPLPIRPGPAGTAPAPAAPTTPTLDVTQRATDVQVVMDEWVDTSAMDEAALAQTAAAVELAIGKSALTGRAGVTRADLTAAGVPLQPFTPPVAQTQQTAVLGRVYAPSTKDVQTAPTFLQSAEIAELATLEKNTKSRVATAEEASRISELRQRQVTAGSALVDADDTTTYELPDGTAITGKIRVTNEVPVGKTKAEPRIFIEPTDGKPAVRVMPEAIGIDSNSPGWAKRLTSAIAAAKANYDALKKVPPAPLPPMGQPGSAGLAAPFENLPTLNATIGPVTLPAAQRPNPALMRRDDTGVPDVLVAPATLDLLATPQYADTVMESLTRTASTPQKRSMATFLLDKLKRVQTLNGVDIPVQVVPNLTFTNPKTGAVERVSGLYSRSGGQATILLDQESGQTEEVIGHEVGHAVSLAYMEAPMESLNPTQQAARVDIESIYQRVLEQPWAKMFEIPNIGEFITEAWNNPRMQKAMKDTPYTGKLSVWGKFKESLRQLMGINKLQMPDNQFEAMLVASDALTRTGMRDPMLDQGTPARQRRAPPEDATPQDVTPQKQVRQIQEIIDDEAETEQEQASKSRDDFMEAGLDNERGLLRGSAYLFDAANDIWVGKWFNANGSVVEDVVQGQGNMRSWLESFRTIEGDKIVARSTVQRTSKDSGYKNTYAGTMDRLDALTPGMRDWYGRAVAIGMSPDAAYSAVMGARNLNRIIVSRSGALSAFGPAVVEGFNRRRAQARAQVASYGYDYASLRDLTETVYAGVDAVAAQGIPTDLVKEYLNAQSAVQNNALKLAKLPTDMAGRPRLDKGDFVKFSYYEDASGNAHTTNAPGRTLVDGVSAPQKFVEAFNKQYPDTRAQLKQVLDNVRATNKYVLDEQLAMGVLGPEDYSKLLAQDLYLPNQQLIKGKKASGYISRALGRTTKAESPVDQWQGVLASRLEAAYYKGGIMDLVRHLQANPNPAIATINSSDLKPVEHPDVDEDGNVVNPSKRIAADWTGENSLTGWVGARQVKITFNDPIIAKALKPGAGVLTDWPAVRTALNMARYATTMLVATPAFWLKSATWDLLSPAVFTQGSFNTDGRELTLGESLRLTAGTYKRIIPALAASAKQSYGEAVSGGLSPKSTDPLRTLYNSRAGGVNLSAVHTSHDALLQSQSNLSGLRAKGNLAFETITATGHIMSDAVRFASFRAFLEQANGGKFKSDAELRTFVDNNPAVVDNAILGSKKLLGNYEDVGQQVLLRSIIPFFNAATVGMTQQIPKAYGTSQGRGAMAVLTGLALFAALAATEDDEDEDTDGFGKHLRRNSSYESLHIGDAVIPVPHEMRMALLAGNFLAAQMSNKKQDMDKITSMAIKIGYQTLIPIPGLASGAEGRSFATDFGPIGTLLLLTGNNDPWGKARVNKEWTENAENRAKGLYNFPNNKDTAWAVAASKGIYDATGLNIAPTTVDMLAQIPSGGWYSLVKEMEKASADGRTEGQAFEDWLLKAYEPSKDDPYASLTRWQNEQKSAAASENLLQVQDYDATAKRVKELNKGLSKTMEGQADARRAGDANLWSQYERERRAKQAGADAVRKQYYERTGNANRNLLQ